MLTKAAFDETLHRCGTLVLDGALATELETRGHDLSHPLWSGKTLREHPEAIKEIHLDYFNAGADVAITASYQASLRGLQEHLQLDETAASNLIKASVSIAQAARDEVCSHSTQTSRNMIVAGSVGPYGAYLADGSEYRGDYNMSSEELKSFHRPRIQALIEAGVDVLAMETMPNFVEIRALVELLRDDFSSAIAWISCTLRDAEHLSDSTPLRELLEVINTHKERVVAFGTNCIPPSLVSDFLTYARSLTNIPLMCYPNSGEEYDAQSHSWTSQNERSSSLIESAERWRLAGARVIGGCCRTNPEDIGNLAEDLHAKLWNRPA